MRDRRQAVVTDPARSKSRLQGADGEAARAFTFYRPMQVWGALGVMMAVLGAIPFLRFLYLLAQGDANGHVQPLVGGLVMLALAVLLYIVGLRVTTVGIEDVGNQSQDEQATR